jgi:uncharacterized protein YuzE
MHDTAALRCDVESMSPICLPRPVWLDYDAEADVLYLHFEEKPASTHSEMLDEGIILDYRGDRLVGLTILEASCR